MSTNFTPLILVGTLGGLAWAGMSGKLPATLQATWNKYLGSGGISPPIPLPPGPPPGPGGPPIISSAGFVCTCGGDVGKGTTTTKTWAAADAELKAAGWGGLNPAGVGPHDQGEANVYQHTCGGPSF